MKKITGSDLSYQLKCAYRKYKTHVYYDNYSQIQRYDLADFEFSNFSDESDKDFSQDNFDKYFEDLANELINNFDIIIEDILNNINVISFPKTLINDDKIDSINNMISNYYPPKDKVTKIHYFIDLPIEGHILGVLWILRLGYILDDKLYDHCYGNRINKSVLENLKKNKSSNFSPFLFEPYYKNYQSWRDKGLSGVYSLLKNNQNAIMLSLDFKDYYYRSLINFEDLFDYIKENKNNEDDSDICELDNNLNKFIQKVFEVYSDKFERKTLNKSFYPYEDIEFNNSFSELPMIPLGFLPSLIISNWNLQGFDQAILENVNPFYYGRYVDDVLIVLGSHKRNESLSKQFIQEITLKEVIQKYFTSDGVNPLNNILKYELNDNNKSSSVWKLYNQKIFNKDNYYHYENLQIQDNKLRIYKFHQGCSDAIIKNFRKNIYLNSSEFRLMHDFGSIFNSLEDNLYKIEYKDSINKLNDIKDVRINKFEISKLLTRLNLLSKNMVNDKIDNKLIDDILNAFKENILEFMILWEKLFSFLYINCPEDKLIDFINYILEVIDKLEVVINSNEYNYTYYLDLNKHNLGFKKDNFNESDNLKYSLLKFLNYSLLRTLSLKSFSDDIENVLININDKINNQKLPCNLKVDYSSKSDIIKYLFSLMQNNSLMKYPLCNSYYEFNENGYDLIKPNNKFVEHFFGIYPRFIKFNELILYEINKRIFFNNGNSNDTTFLFDDSYIKSANENYHRFNYGLDRNPNLFNIQPLSYNLLGNNISKVINIPGNKKRDYIKIGLLNTKLDYDNITKRLKNNPNLSHKRFDKIKLLINEAIKKKVELLVMPEMYIPYEWVNEIVKISKDHQMAIIFGVEPIVNEDDVGNYIMSSLPFVVNNKYFESLLVYRLKNHYAPEELKEYKRYDKKPISYDKNKYHLFIWNDIYIAPYYCFEIADIHARSIFKSCCDIVTVSEFNKDTKYFNNIAEALSRDLFCYCIKANTSEFGGTIILQPSSSESKYLVNLKGGDDEYIVTHNLNIKKLREDAIKNDEYIINSNFKPKPPGFNREKVKKRMGLNND